MQLNALVGEIKRIYDAGENVIDYVNGLTGGTANSTDAILISYDLQAGTYVAAYEADPGPSQRAAQAMVDVLKPLGPIGSVMEAGVGEATTFREVCANLDLTRETPRLGFDLSWSRINAARAFLRGTEQADAELFVADLFNIPLADSSVDVVYTSHTLEPNGGREREALTELYRVAGRYLVLFEPAYELAGPEARARMERFGYVRGLASTAESLGYTVTAHHLLSHTKNPLNPTGCVVIEKPSERVRTPALCCPVTKTPLTAHDGAMFSAEALLAYPVLSGIPCLKPEHAILASQLLG